jgi:hypothetical protein
VIEGEDIVQDALARAFYALSLSPEVPPLRPWLFRIALEIEDGLVKSIRDFRYVSYIAAEAEFTTLPPA